MNDIKKTTKLQVFINGINSYQNNVSSWKVNLWTFLLYGILSLVYFQDKNLFLLLLVSVYAEIINTCFEQVCDLVEPNYHPKVKIIKDMASFSSSLISVSMYAMMGYYLLQKVNI